MPSTTLSALLAVSGYRIAYAVPLLLLSAVHTFAGAFLTLDRTCAFPPAYDALPGAVARLPRWPLRGGAGGAVSAFLFGIHSATFLALLIPAKTTSAALSPAAFLAVWVLVAIPAAALGGRFKFVALILSGITGGAALALGLAVITHPSLSARIGLVATFSSLLAILTAVPFRTRRPALRVATTATGAFGVVVAIAILASVPPWANVWERLWTFAGDWGSPPEHALSAAFALLFALGNASDYLLHTRLGPAPDENWDQYLAHYANNLPTRAGHFRPSPSLWARLFSHTSSDPDAKLPAPPPQKLRARTRPAPPRRRTTVAFPPPPGADSDSDSDGASASTDTKVARGSGAVSDATLVGGAKFEAELAQLHGAAPEYSDGEDAPKPVRPRSKARSSAGSTAPPGAVPATPSLLNALDRVAAAQHDAHAPRTPTGLPAETGLRWDAFWREVDAR